jgi:hypothetical protein
MRLGIGSVYGHDMSLGFLHNTNHGFPTTQTSDRDDYTTDTKLENSDHL